MLRKKLSISVLLASLVMLSAFSMEYDKQYAQAYGTGVIIASDKGLPLRNKFDKTQVDFKNGTSFIKGGSGATLNFRAFLKDGKDYSYYMGLFKKNYDPKSIVEESEKIVVSFWASHSFRGDKQMTTWPKKLGDEPENGGYLGHMDFYMGEVMDYKDSGADWANISENFDGVIVDWLLKAKSGYKLYVSLNIGLVVNTTWDEYKQQWNTMWCPSAPLAAGTVEIK